VTKNIPSAPTVANQVITSTAVFDSNKHAMEKRRGRSMEMPPRLVSEVVAPMEVPL
jgi:hypothetical protein